MVPVPKNSISHFIHPEHQLNLIDDDDQEYTCGGCMTHGHGKRYKCQSCSFDMHEYCGMCPKTLSSFMHNNHALRLVVRKAQSERQVDRLCNVCNETVERMFYRCKDCEFDVHPLCTQLPEKLHHTLHEIHTLCLESEAITGSCAVCGGLCNGWRYRCKDCNFDIHLDCVLLSYNQSEIPFEPPPQFASDYTDHDRELRRRTRMRTMFALVGRVGLSVLSTVMFGADLTEN